MSSRPPERKRSLFQNPFGRMHVPEGFGHILCTPSPTDETITITQYANDLENPRHRPIVVTQKNFPALLTRIDKELKKNALCKENTDINALSVTPEPINTLPLAEPPVTPPRPKRPRSSSNTELSCSTPNGSIYTSSRGYTIEHPSGTSVGLFFSPQRKKDAVSHFAKKIRGSKEAVEPDFENFLENSADPQSSTQIKGGIPQVVKPGLRNRKTAKSAKTIMGRSAEKEILNSAEFSNLLKSLANFPLEWLHCLAFSLSPEEYDPQVPENFGAGPAWINTYMMVLENVARVFSKLYPGAVSVSPRFEMHLKKNVIDKIYYSVQIKKGDQLYTIRDQIDALSLPSKENWPSVTDDSQIIDTINAFLEGKTPSSSITLRPSKLY